MLLFQSCQYAYLFSSVNLKPLIFSALHLYHSQKALSSRASTNPLALSAFSLGYKTRMFACFPYLHPWDGHSLGWHRLGFCVLQCENMHIKLHNLREIILLNLSEYQPFLFSTCSNESFI